MKRPNSPLVTLKLECVSPLKLHSSLLGLWDTSMSSDQDRLMALIDLWPLPTSSRNSYMQLSAGGSKTTINSHSDSTVHTRRDRSNDRLVETGVTVWLRKKYDGSEDSGRPHFTFSVTLPIERHHLHFWDHTHAYTYTNNRHIWATWLSRHILPDQWEQSHVCVCSDMTYLLNLRN